MLFEYQDKNNEKKVISLHDLVQTLMEEKYGVDLSHDELEPIVDHIKYQI